MHMILPNQITAHNAGWRTQFRFAGNASWSGVCEFWRSSDTRRGDVNNFYLAGRGWDLK